MAAGNILRGAAVVDAMVESFEENEDQPLAERLVRAIDAGDAAGGGRLRRARDRTRSGAGSWIAIPTGQPACGSKALGGLMARPALRRTTVMSRIRPARFVHVVYRTRRFEQMVQWYETVFDATVRYQNPVLAFLSYDD
ncbi:MAG: DUF1028 domain-containing protein, partial [Reyranellales bacterium]